MKNEKKIRETLDNIIKHGWGVADFRNCGLTDIPKEIFDYPDIVSLNFSNSIYLDEDKKNKITTIPPEIGKLKKLARINLENNKVSKISEQISELTRLRYLNLSNNELKDLPEKVANMKGLEELIISGNPFDMLPPEIVARGIMSIRNFFKELKEQDFIYEVKLLIVGEGRVGKTCIANALIRDDYELEKEVSTEGININSWIIPKEEISSINPQIERDFQINIWDFGGQEIYHSTHQFFLTKRSIYLLVTESRKEDSHDDFFYWLNIIKLLGDNSPVVMALNKCDQPTKELPIKEYRSAFNNIIQFNKISLTKEKRDAFNDFKTSLKKIASELPHIGNPLPKVWVDIRRDIEALKIAGHNYISQDEYFEICKKHYRREDSALTLSEFFHDIGVIIHFQDDIDLKDIVILNHEWITKGVYKVLDDRKVIENNGRFSLDDIKRIWANEEHRLKIRELVSLMKNTKFDLCFELENGEFLVPRLLPVDEVEHNWESSTKNAKFEVRYKFMPKGIVARLIVKMNSDILDKMYWRYGVILQYDGTKAIIKEKYFENKITIELSGKNKREFLFLIRKAINEIHNDFNNIEFSEMIPCNCKTCSIIENPHFYSFSLLRRYELNDIMNIRCDKSLIEVPVFNLTSDIARKAISEEAIIICENKNATLLNNLSLSKTSFFPEKDSSSVFMKIKLKPELFGLRDRDFLLDTEIEKIKRKYHNLFILDYYCLENYLYHPSNIDELELEGFNVKEYVAEIIHQKNNKKNHIISIYRNARNTYQEFRIEAEKLRDQSNEHMIIEYLESDDINVFFKSFSMKDQFNKKCLEKYGLTDQELSNTKWFRDRMTKIIAIN